MACPPESPFVCLTSGACYETMNACLTSTCETLGEAAIQCVATLVPTSVPASLIPVNLVPARSGNCPSETPYTCTNARYCYSSPTDCAAECAGYNQSGQCASGGLSVTILVSIIVPCVICGIAFLCFLIRSCTEVPTSTRGVILGQVDVESQRLQTVQPEVAKETPTTLLEKENEELARQLNTLVLQKQNDDLKKQIAEMGSRGSTPSPMVLATDDEVKPNS